MPSEKNSYFSIGEFSKIMKVSPKSVLYYEKLGILEPAFTDPESRFRYYSPTQLAILSSIRICIQLGVPLREFGKYRSGNLIRTSRLLEDAASCIQRSIRQLQCALDETRKLQHYVRQCEELQQAGDILPLDFEEHLFLTARISPDISDTALLRVLGQLQREADARGLKSRLTFGKIACFRQGQLTGVYAAHGVSGDAAGDNIITLPAGTYSALACSESRLCRAPELFPSLFSEGDSHIAFECYLIPGCQSTVQSSYMLRCLPL